MFSKAVGDSLLPGVVEAMFPAAAAQFCLRVWVSKNRLALDTAVAVCLHDKYYWPLDTCEHPSLFRDRHRMGLPHFLVLDAC